MHLLDVNEIAGANNYSPLHRCARTVPIAQSAGYDCVIVPVVLPDGAVGYLAVDLARDPPAATRLRG